MTIGRKTGGRKRGTPNRATAAKTAAIEASGLSPLDHMLSVMRDEKADAHRRDDMAKAATPYVHPRIAPIDGSKRSSEGELPLIERLKESPARVRSSLRATGRDQTNPEGTN